MQKKTTILGILLIPITVGIALYLKTASSSITEHNDAIAGQIVASEEMMESQRKQLKKLSQVFTFSTQPAEMMPEIFTETFRGNHLDRSEKKKALLNQHSSISQWSASQLTPTPKGKGWAPFAHALSSEANYDFFKVYMIKGHFEDDNTFQAKMGVKGRLQEETSGQWVGFRGKQTVHWKLSPENKWQIASWEIKEFETLNTQTPIFEDVTEKVITSAHTLYQAQRSQLEEFFIDGYKGKPVKMNVKQAHLSPYLERAASALHPALSVVDYDGDGWDDLYMTVRLGENMLLRNKGDGTFEDTTKEAGLNVLGFSTSALFADFDNDGDQDLFLGRHLLPSLYFENIGGRFINKTSERFHCELPKNVTSLSAADYNQDGYLDIYVSTYGILGKGTRDSQEKNRPFIAPDRFEKFASGLEQSHRYLNLTGPPNLLIINNGENGFDRAPEFKSLETFYNTLQASWSDYDDDGDPDLYIANDFAPDMLMRNDGKDANGHVIFTNATKENGHPTMVGFGMGIGWGDYNRDGKQDLYVSNMFSKAGMRITGQVPNIDPRIRQSAEGSRLFSFNGNNFDLKSLPEKDGLDVNQSGWAWGGQFVDVDNDGWLDLYSTNGHYTAHPEITNEADG